jgi:hypothetical protein
MIAMPGMSQAKLLVSGYEPAVNDRFYTGADKSFLGDPFDFSGVGNTANTNGAGTGRWATLISPTYFLSAWHFRPAALSTVTFFENNDASGPSHTYTVASGQKVAGTDLFLGKLTAPVATSDKIHPFAIVADNKTALMGATIGVYGAPNRLGLNSIDGFGTFGPSSGLASTGEAFTYDYDTANGFDPGEAQLHGGDSGGPSFVVTGGQLALVGIHWFTYSDSNDPTVAGSGDTYVSPYITQINALMTGGEQLTVLSVPEPSTILLLAAGLPCVGLLLRRRS